MSEIIAYPTVDQLTKKPDDEQLYSEMAKADIPREDARHMFPGETTRGACISANFREFRHSFAVRRYTRADREIRGICLKTLEILKEKAPIVFHDWEIDWGTISAGSLNLINLGSASWMKTGILDYRKIH